MAMLLALLAVTASSVTLLVPYPTVQHFIWPLHWCLLADICNHTYIPECGTENALDVYNRRLFIDECDMFEYNCDYEADYYPINYSSCFNLPPTPCPPIPPCPSIPTCPDHRFHNVTQLVMPLHPCLMAKVCNHTGLKMCGLEKDQRDGRLFLDDCDMFEYNCDYKKAYSKIDDKFCKEDITESEKTLTPGKEETSDSSQTVDKQTTSNATTLRTAECTCSYSHSKPPSMRTAIEKTSKRISKTSEKISISRVTETRETESIKEIMSNSTGTLISAETKRCSCMDAGIPTSISNLETNIPNTQTYLKTEESTTLPITKSTQTISGSVSSSAQIYTTCPCNSVSPETYETITTKTQPKSETIAILTKPMTSVSGTIIAKCTCMDLKTTLMPTTESTITSTQSKHECTCSHLHSETTSMKTAIDKTAERKSNSSETTAAAEVSERTNITESIRRRTYANVSRIPIATKCTRGNHNSTSIATSKKQNSDSVTKSSAVLNNSTDTVSTAGTKGRCTCLDIYIPTSLSHFETNSITTETYSKTEKSSTSPITNVTETVSTSAQTKSCTCNSVSHETYETITTQTETEIITIQTKPMTPASSQKQESPTGKCTCMDLQTTPMPSTESTPASLTTGKCTCMDLQTTPMPSTESTPGSRITGKCTCMDLQTTPMPSTESTPASGITGKCTCMDLQTTPMPSTKSTITTIHTKHGCTCTPHSEYTTLKHCDKYPKHCKRPLTWETTARGETRDFFQILKERFGNRVKMLRDTTHWPMRMTKSMEKNEAFHFGAHNDI